MAVSRTLRFQILRRDNHTCRYCGRTPPEVKLTADHVIPEALGGSDHPSNLVTACEECNGGKSATPPDASHVAAVADDALRWSTAMRAAADKMMSEHKAAAAFHDRFKQAWMGWGYDTTGAKRVTFPLPPNWTNSIDNFLAAGLPLDLVLACIPPAMGARTTDEKRFNYMCGVAWKKITKLQEAARESLGGQRVTSQPDADEESWAQALLMRLVENPDEYDSAVARAQHEIKSDDDEVRYYETTDSVQYAIEAKIDTMYGRLLTFDIAAGLLLNALTLDDRITVRELAHHDLINSDDEYDEIDVKAQAIRHFSHLLSGQFLATLPEDEAHEWREAAASAGKYHIDNANVLNNAARYAREHKTGGRYWPSMCNWPGDRGAVCADRAVYICTFEDCPLCVESPCRGHKLWCERHFYKVLNGEAARTNPSATGLRIVEAYPDPTPEPPF